METPHNQPYDIDPALPRGTCRLVRRGDAVVLTVDSVDTAQALVLAVSDWLLGASATPSGGNGSRPAR
ncbi:MAG: hypothetical protein Kow0010_17270 [Dehalococcoidia bacterium]